MIDPLLSVSIAMVVFLLFLMMGMPIFAALGLGGILGIFLVDGQKGLLFISGIVYGNANSWGILAVPLFLFMGNLLVRHKIGEDMYEAVYRWLGRFKGGLAIVSTLFAAMFGFMCGSSVAGVATVGGVALPEMLNRGYDKRLAAGTLALAGSTAGLIPPSLLMILYGIITEASLGKMFIAGIIPGFILVLLMMVYIVLRVTANPELAPPGPRFPWGKKFKSLVHLMPLLIIFICIIGGLYLGVCSPLEAGAIGSVAAFFLCLAYRRVTWETLKGTSLNTMKTFVMIYMLLLGAGLISHLFFISGISAAIGSGAAALALPPWATIIVIWLIMMVMGFFLDPPAIVLITVPVFLPVVESLGFDIVWYGIVNILAAEAAQLTPPVGIGLFIIHSIAPEETTMKDCIMGSMPYVGILTILLVLLIIFPEIAIWLPGKMK